MFSDTYTAVIADPAEFISKHFFVPMQHKNTQIRVDIAAALSGFEHRVISRSQRSVFNNIGVNVCSCEDLILMKHVAGRPQDILDIEKIVLQNQKDLDIHYLHTSAQEFVEVERSDVVQQLETVLKKT